MSTWLLVGLAAAVSALFLFAGFPNPVAGALFAVLASLPIFLLGLSLGWFAAIAAGGAAFVALVPSLGLAAALYYALVNAIPSGLLIWQAERTRSDPGRLTLVLTGYSCAVIALAVMYFSTSPGGLAGVIREQLDGMLSVLVTNPALGPTAPVSEQDIAALADLMAAFFPAMVAGTWLVLLAVNAALAQGGLSRFGRAILPTPDIADLRLPRWYVMGLVAAVALSYLDGGLGYLGANTVPIVLLGYLFVGLGVMHAILRRWSSGMFWLVTVYFLLFLFGWLAVPIIFVGLLDTLFDFRNRFGPPSTGTE